MIAPVTWKFKTHRCFLNNVITVEGEIILRKQDKINTYNHMLHQPEIEIFLSIGNIYCYNKYFLLKL